MAKFIEVDAGGTFREREIQLNDLYQEVILDHNRRPRNFKKLANATAYAHGVNPLCGDDYQLFLNVDENGIIKEVGFEGQGCAISKASASMMTVAIQGQSKEEARRLQEAFIHLLTDGTTSEAVRLQAGKLKIFEGVKQFPIRVKCAALIWRALEAALKDSTEKKEVSTE